MHVVRRCYFYRSLIHRCDVDDDTTATCDSVLNTTLYFRPSSQLNALKDLTEIRNHVIFKDSRCDTAVKFSACYLLRVPCVDSLPMPICMDDCIVAETILKYSCVDEFNFLLAVVNNSLSQTLERFDCQRPESYIEGTKNYSTQCVQLIKLRKYLRIYVCLCYFKGSSLP